MKCLLPKVALGFQLGIAAMGIIATGQAQAYTRFQYQLSGSPKNLKVQWVFIDLFETSSSKISSFKRQGKKVICYFSAGTYENWRPDQSQFPSSAVGNALEDWPGERWLDTRSAGILKVMRSRLALAQAKGCSGVDLDNVDGYGNDTGFGLKKNDSIKYLRSLASDAHGRGLLIGLKNSAEIAGNLVSTMDFAVVEECMEYQECGRYAPFVKKGKKVFLIEYSSASRSQCNQADAWGMNLVFANYDLNGNFKVCH